MAIQLGTVGSIAVVRANALGDYILAEPALSALRAAAPSAHIALIADQWQAGFLQERAAPVDEVVVAPWKVGVRTPPPGQQEDPAELGHFFARMRDRQFDVAVQLHGGGRNSNPFTKALGARHTVGLRAEDAPELDATVSYQYWQHETMRYLEVMGLLGARPVRYDPVVAVVPDDRDRAARALAGAGARTDLPIAVVHPGATDPRRRWPTERFSAVARDLLGAGAQVVVIGAAQEQDLAQEVVAQADGTHNLAGKLDLGALAGLLSMCSIMVGNDSGPRHLAQAVGAPTVSVYWFGNVINAGPLPRDRHRVHISWTIACPVCGTPCVGQPFPEGCEHRVSFVADVPTALVSQSALAVYAEAVTASEA